jgi:alcohol dehydrogenase class IV
VTRATRHVEAARTIVFGAGALEATAELAGPGFTLLTTSRAAAAAPEVAGLAGAVIEVPAGAVDEIAGDLRGRLGGARVLVALGGGRVIDAAKALAAADPPRTVVAIPTTLSAAEMTAFHRHARGVPAATRNVRPGVVLNDPLLSGSQPADQLAASTANALGHAFAALLRDRSTPIGAAAAREAVRRLIGGWGEAEPDRPQLARGALLAGWAVDHAGLGLHHALAQTAVRSAGVAHARANAALLPETLAALAARRPEAMAELESELGLDLAVAVRRLRRRAGADLGPLADDSGLLERTVEAASRRSELERVLPAPDHSELRSIYLAAARPSGRSL